MITAEDKIMAKQSLYLVKRRRHNLFGEDHGDVTIASSVKNMLLPNCRRPKLDDVTVTSGEEKIPLPS